MHQFTVPQFIDVEDKIIGPITTRQFLIMLAGFMVIGISYKIFDFTLFITFSILVFLVAGIFSFLKINGRPFHFFILNFIQTLKKTRLRIWNNIIGKTDADYMDLAKSVAEEKPTAVARRYTTSRLAELALIVDTQGAFRGDEDGLDDILTTTKIDEKIS